MWRRPCARFTLAFSAYMRRSREPWWSPSPLKIKPNQDLDVWVNDCVAYLWRACSSLFDGCNIVHLNRLLARKLLPLPPQHTNMHPRAQISLQRNAGSSGTPPFALLLFRALAKCVFVNLNAPPPPSVRLALALLLPLPLTLLKGNAHLSSGACCSGVAVRATTK